MASLSTLFEELKQLTKARSLNQATTGLVGSWTPEVNFGDDVLRYIMGDGGYSQHVYSYQFKFRIDQKYTFTTGTVHNLQEGTLADIEQCIEFMTSELPQEVALHIRGAT
jgi:hypothetical protein